MSTDLKLMANEMMSNAVNYMLNQWKSLVNFIKDGRVQISNNLCEQRMKPVKLNLKNCQNIGSENIRRLQKKGVEETQIGETVIILSLKYIFLQNNVFFIWLYQRTCLSLHS